MTFGPQHALLVAAVCRPPTEAGRALAQWRAQCPLDDVDDAGHALLPALARRTELLRDHHPDKGRLRGIYRRSWVHNTLLLEQAEPALEALRDACGDVALIGAAAMPAYFDGDVGARPMEWVDVLIRTGQDREADALFADAHWRPVGGGRWSHPDGGRIHVHDRLIPSALSLRADEQVWAATQRLSTTAARMLDPADQLVHLLVTGAAQTPAWVVDAHRLITQDRQPTRLAQHVAHRARTHAVVHRCCAQLEVVARETERDAVDGLLRALATTRPRWTERWDPGKHPTRPGRAITQLAGHTAGHGSLQSVGSLIAQRLDLTRVPSPALTVTHAALGRPPAVMRLARNLGAAPPRPSRRALHLGPLVSQTVLDFSEPSVAAAYSGAGWGETTGRGLSSHGNEARIVLPVAEDAKEIVLTLGVDQPAQVLITANDTDEQRTHAGPANVVVHLPVRAPGVVELALRSSERRGIWPRPLFVVLKQIRVTL